MVYLVPETLVFLPEQFDLVLPFEEPSLEVVFLASDHTKSVLHITKLKHLPLTLLLC